MQARRKPVDPAATAPPVDAVSAEPEIPVDLEMLRRMAGGDAPVSPALLLREQLAARLAAVEAATVDTPVADVTEFKLPMGLRVATIVMLSAALWGGIYLAAIKIITG